MGWDRASSALLRFLRKFERKGTYSGKMNDTNLPFFTRYSLTLCHYRLIAIVHIYLYGLIFRNVFDKSINQNTIKSPDPGSSIGNLFIDKSFPSAALYNLPRICPTREISCRSHPSVIHDRISGKDIFCIIR